MYIGSIDGYPVTYDSARDTATCKDFTVPAAVMIRTWDSPIDREKVLDNLTLHKKEMWVQLGCFRVTVDQAKELIRNLKNIRNEQRSS